jgi:sterol desaturase/sphingolipid hydroxylase (fatty acid hydroxylase superfamily)
MDKFFVCLGIVIAFLIVFGFFAFLRYLRHREIIAMAEQGLPYPEQRNGKEVLRWGIIITILGFALLIGTLPFAFQGLWILGLIGLIPTFLGLSLLLFYVLTQEE